jgi:hypothetical protein
VPFALDEQLINEWIAKKHKSNFEVYAFIINNLIKHADAKAYNRHILSGRMKPGELLSVGQEALGLLLLENYWAPWEQLVNAMKAGQQGVPSSEAVPTKYTSPRNKRNPWSKEGYERYNVLHEEVRRDRLSVEGRKFEGDFQKMMLDLAGKSTSRKRKTVAMVEVAAVHELDSDSDDEEHSGTRAAGTTSTVSELSSGGTVGSVPV